MILADAYEPTPGLNPDNTLYIVQRKMQATIPDYSEDLGRVAGWLGHTLRTFGGSEST
jgi:hypothetical protein